MPSVFSNKQQEKTQNFSLFILLYKSEHWATLRFYETYNKITNKGLIYSILAGLIIGVANIAILAMYHYKAPLSVAVPITRTGGMLLTVVLGILLFSEILTIKQVIGIILGIISILFLI